MRGSGCYTIIREHPRSFYYSSRQHPITGMVAFDCNWCGKCCASFGAFIKIERQLTSRDFYCRYGVKNELFLAHVEGEYADSQPPSSETGVPVKGCPFMRKNKNGNGIACAIYATRPQICREFRCYRMVIFDHEGHECGRIMGRSELKTADESLAQIWKTSIVPLPHSDDARWEKSVIAALAAHGYRGEPVE